MRGTVKSFTTSQVGLDNAVWLAGQMFRRPGALGIILVVLRLSHLFLVYARACAWCVMGARVPATDELQCVGFALSPAQLVEPAIHCSESVCVG